MGIRCSGRSLGSWIVVGCWVAATAAEPVRPAELPTAKSLAELKAMFPREHAPFTDQADREAATRFTASIQRAALVEDFADIQRQFDAAFAGLGLLPGGQFQYVALFDALSRPHSLHLRDNKTRVEFCTRWLQAFPKSTAAAALRIDAQLSYAWEARGGGYAYTITEEGGRRFEERLAPIAGWIEQAEKNPINDPLYFFKAIEYARATGGGHERIEDLVRRSAASPLLNFRPFNAAAEYYLPRWAGGPGELENFALRAYELTKHRTGAAVYADVVINTARYHADQVFRDFQLSYPLFEQGIIDAHQRAPNSSLPAEHLALMICYVGDREKAKAIFDHLGDAPKQYWRDDLYQQYRAWAERDPLKLGKTIFELTGWTGPLAWEADGKALLGGSGAGLHRIVPDEGFVDLPLPMENLKWFDRSRDGRYLAIVTTNGRAAVYDLQEKTVDPLHFSTQNVGFVHVHITADQRVLARSTDGKLYSWLLKGPDHGEQSWDLARGHPWAYEAVTPDGESILAKPERITGLALWNTRTGAATNVWHAPAPAVKLPSLPSVYLPRSTAVSPDGKLAVLGLDRRLQLWTLGEAKPTSEAAFGNASVAYAAFTPDGKRLLTAMWRFLPKVVDGKPTVAETESEILLWSVPDLHVLQKFAGHGGTVMHVAVSPDGKRFASAGKDRTIRIWTLPP